MLIELYSQFLSKLDMDLSTWLCKKQHGKDFLSYQILILLVISIHFLSRININAHDFFSLILIFWSHYGFFSFVFIE